MRRFLAALFLGCAVLFFVTPSNAGINSISAAWDKLAELTFPIYGPNGSMCTAFVFEARFFQYTSGEQGSALLATAGHCATYGIKYFDPGLTISTAYIAIGMTGNADFAVGYLPGDSLVDTFAIRDTVAEPLQSGEEVLTLGWGEGNLREVVGHYLYHDENAGDYPVLYGTDEFVAVSGQSRPGMSGAPVVDAQGRLIGILTHGVCAVDSNGNAYGCDPTGLVPDGTVFDITRISTIQQAVDVVAPPWFPPQ